MKTELRLTVAAIAAALPMLSASASQTINFGETYAPVGALPNGYKGFDWYGAQNGVYADSTGSVFGSADIAEFGRAKAFDLDSIALVNFGSDVPSGGDTISFATTVSGYYNGTLVKSVTEDYGWGGGFFSGIDIDGVNKITFATTDTRTIYGEPGTFTGSDDTLVSQLTVSKAGVVAAPEMDRATAASALTLTIGGLLVLQGRRSKRQSAVSA
jgi:hypothetical protein